ncbi:hypothetical protein BBF96_10460 [Anoxybacter fermentans]|uniref:Aminoglycoside phosphotransferase domain-containing protein n=1 Tax=Anoxybacter fermentans TaxID=1323375 RepID=A0A3Q9HR64_9FIRM|nr:hypothetical protein [Anoxybacter fermentans]AZR73770.1 hypothetical protein BBF96_10460 [Anoxybacter fermentans]
MFNLDQLKEVIEKNYPFKVIGITPVKGDQYRVETDQGYRRLARVQIKSSKLIFVYSVVTELRERGMNQVPVIYQTNEGRPNIQTEHSNWVLMDWVNGRTPELNVISDVKQITQDLALLHKYMSGISLESNGKGKEDWSKWPERLIEGRRIFNFYMEKIKSKSGSLSDFDQMFLKESLLLKERIEKAMELALSLSCQHLIQKEKNERSVTYHQMKEKEFLIGLDSRTYFINPLKVHYDLRVKDLGKWIKRLVKKVSSKRVLKRVIPQVINWYEEERSLSRGEKVWLLSYLLYPSKVVKMIDRYQLRKKNWSEEGYVRKLRKALEGAAREMKVYQEILKMFKGMEER